jgi:pimeloyl-ACP methyl ester carboxylesterase
MGVNLIDGMEGQFPAGLRKVVVEDAGHFLQLEQPDRVAEEVLGFLMSGL